MQLEGSQQKTEGDVMLKIRLVICPMSNGEPWKPRIQGREPTLAFKKDDS